MKIQLLKKDQTTVCEVRGKAFCHEFNWPIDVPDDDLKVRISNLRIREEIDIGDGYIIRRVK